MKKKGGVAIYFDLFDFNDVIDFLRKEYNLDPPVEEIKYGSKFGLVLYFDKDLNFLKDMTFFTVSGYIRYYRKVPKTDEFLEYEDELKTKLGQFFDINEDENKDIPDSNDPGEKVGKGQMTDPAKFNEAIDKILSIHRDITIDIKDCRLQMVNNIESDASNLHSFFIEDLEKAKDISTQNLDKYILGADTEHINLDSKKDSVNFAPSILEKILQPRNYPLGRFPSKTEFSLSFMQQIAVNLSVGFDESQIRSVNGPPGTGKTTLLKDIFAELVVKQAYDICKLKDRCISGTEDTRYYDKASIGIVPDHIAENSIVVASSNNGAVQNIVNELPLVDGIDQGLIDELKEADYFCDISNSTVKEEWKDNKQELSIISRTEALFWGLFSLEGGKADNVKNILSNMKAICSFFDEFEEDDEIYESFLKQYKELEDRRKKAQDFADKLHRRDKEKRTYEEKVNDFDIEKEKRETDLRQCIEQAEKDQKKCDARIEKLRRDLGELQKDADGKAGYKEEVYRIYQMASAQKPGLFARKSDKEEYSERIREIQSKYTQAVDSEKECNEKIREINKQIQELENEQSSWEKALRNKHGEFQRWEEIRLEEIRKLEESIRSTDALKGGSGLTPLDLGIAYDDLQKSNPWFDKKFRISQSRLFIAALKVRKQFLYENKKNIKAAFIIWNSQNKYLENKIVIEAAWKWINMTIPVISSTFASFGRMCKNLGPDTIGHLFIDEAGQTLPQAAVGAIFRSRHVMVVGNPAQIKPVLTLDPNVLGMLGKHFDVSERYLSESASTQTLVDAVSQYGFYRDKDKEESSWIGIPLWVHRRCQYPMFTISNKISYGNLMVQGKPGNGKAGWYDVKGKADNKYVEEQGEFLLKKLSEMIKDNPRIIDKNEMDEVYVISPFANVAYRLSQKLKKIGFTRYDGNGKPTNIGTIHTFQGKEAPVVFMVLGADKQSSGAARWAVNEPNMMNVAATRAKEEFYIIGDKELYLNIGCDVADDTYGVIRKYKKEHPDLVSEAVETAGNEGTGVKNPGKETAGNKSTEIKNPGNKEEKEPEIAPRINRRRRQVCQRSPAGRLEQVGLQAILRQGRITVPV